VLRYGPVEWYALDNAMAYADARAARRATSDAGLVEPLLDVEVVGRGLHSSTFQLNFSGFCERGGERRGCAARLRGCQGVFRVCRVFSCVRHGSG